MKFVSSISSLPISAQSAAFAPTNSADVSAIASAYQVVSATATQLYAGTAYVTSVNGAPLSASRAGNAANASLATSAWYDGTGRLISSLPDSDTVSAIASSYAESAVSGKQDTLTFDYDDGKISAINGSALAGQGGGGMITSIQSALDPWYQASISGLNGSSLYPKWAESAKSARTAATADWAWNAQSASAAPTAWASSFITGVSSPSGTIRVLGGTAIESTNSAVIPSTVIEGFYTAYAGGTTVGPNSKLHCVFPTANPSTEIIMPFLYNPGLVLWSSDNGIEGSQEKDISPETITAQVPNATAVDIWSDSWIEVNSVTASAATQEIGGGVAELAWASAIPTYSYDSEDKISAINGSAIAGGGGGATGDYVEKSAVAVVIGSGNTSWSANNEFVQGTNNSTNGNMNVFVQGTQNTATNGCTFIQGEGNYCEDSYTMAVGFYNRAQRSCAIGTMCSASSQSLAAGYENLASSRSFAQGESNSAWRGSIAQGYYNSAKNTAAVFGQYNLHGDGDTSTGNSAAFAIGDGTATGARHDLMVVTKDGEITMYSGTADTTGTGIMSSIRALSANAGGVDSATVSAIASSYAESAASGKLDSSASSSFYTTANESGFLTGVDLSPYQTTADMSGYMPTSMSSDFQQVTGMSSYALSSDVSATVDLVGTQSANWGGSALQLSAGPGVKLEKSGNVLVAGLDETVLWSGAALTPGGSSAALSEDVSHFERLKVYAVFNPSTGFTAYPQAFEYNGTHLRGGYLVWGPTDAYSGKYACGGWSITNGTSFKQVYAGQTDTYPTINFHSSYGGVMMVVGINRTAEA